MIPINYSNLFEEFKNKQIIPSSQVSKGDA